jgi:hypothetical protein
MSLSSGRRALVFAAAASMVCAVSAAASAQAATVGPDQFFTGHVYGVAASGAATSSTIAVVCPSTANVGHPAPGQSVSVTLIIPPTTALSGFTGTLAKSIEADLTWSTAEPPVSATAELADLTTYSTPEPIPTSILVPCTGAGVVTFAPTPTSPSAVDYNVSITFVRSASVVG